MLALQHQCMPPLGKLSPLSSQLTQSPHPHCQCASVTLIQARQCLRASVTCPGSQMGGTQLLWVPSLAGEGMKESCQSIGWAKPSLSVLSTFSPFSKP